MRITVLASGSKGNATLLEIGDDQYLIDCGLTYRQVKLRLEKQGKELNALKGVFLTHEHRDHVSGLRVLLNNHPVKVYLSGGTMKGLDKRYLGPIDESMFEILKEEEHYEFDGFVLFPFNTYHDALEPFGYKFIEKNHSFVYLTDTGYFPLRKYDLIKNADAYMVESNYESELLLESSRPWMLKRRILDDQGHLSNEDSANLITSLIGDRTKTIILAHLSEDCNLEDEAINTYNICFKAKDIDLSLYHLVIAKQHESIKEITLG